ncbi:MAG TPA: phage tail tape measure protein, partial [Phycisphaerae bacterium]|nr:phage tail tape measure protein [Phycisphaerae bacterium]
GGALKGLATQLRGLLSGYVGIAGLRKAFEALREEQERVVQTTRSVNEALRSTLALSSLQGERPETVRKLWTMAAAGGRKMEEVGPAYYTLLGGTFGMDPERQQGLMRQALLMGKTDISAPLDPLVSMFSTVGTQQPDLAPRQIGNLLSQTIEAAKSTPGEMAAYLPNILTTGKAAGADVATLAAMFSFATRRGGGVARSGTSVQNTLLGLLAPQRELGEQLAAHGLPAGDIMARIAWLGEQGGNLPPELVAALGGRRGIQAVSEIAGSPEKFRAEVGTIRQALAAPGSLLGQRLQGMYGEMPGQRYLDQEREIDVLLDKADQDPDLQRRQMILNFRKLRMRKEGVHPMLRKFVNWADASLQTVLGEETGTDSPSVQAMEDLVSEGYSPRDVLDVVWPDWNAAGQDGHREGSTATWRKRFLDQLRAAGREPMQGDTYQGGTHYHNHDKRDPAGRPQRPAMQP